MTSEQVQSDSTEEVLPCGHCKVTRLPTGIVGWTDSACPVHGQCETLLCGVCPVVGQEVRLTAGCSVHTGLHQWLHDNPTVDQVNSLLEAPKSLAALEGSDCEVFLGSFWEQGTVVAVDGMSVCVKIDGAERDVYRSQVRFLSPLGRTTPRPTAFRHGRVRQSRVGMGIVRSVLEAHRCLRWLVQQGYAVLEAPTSAQRAASVDPDALAMRWLLSLDRPIDMLVSDRAESTEGS